MQGYDVTLKMLITGATEKTLETLGARGPVNRWINVELPKVQNLRVDLLAEIAGGQMLQIELQSSNAGGIPQRMLEYAVGIWRSHGVFPRQVVLYVGNEKLRIPNGFQGDGIDYRYEVIDIRDLDGAPLIESECIADNLLALLTGLPDKAVIIRRILGKIGRLESERQEDAIRKLLILCGLRGLEEIYEEEEKKMPIDLDIMDHKILGPLLRKGIEQGIEQGREQGIEQGIKQGIEQGEKQLLRRLLKKRFGSLPTWADKRLDNCSRAEAEELAMKVIDAKGLEELFP